MQRIRTFFMFPGQAEEAIHFYLSLFENSELLSIERYGQDDPGGAAGTVKLATFQVAGQEFMAIDTNIEHGFGFTPSMSLYVHCRDEQEIERLFEQLTSGGQVLMPLEAYPFSPKFAWVADRFGVSWQLALAAGPSDPSS